MSSGQISGNNKTWLARHLKTLSLQIMPRTMALHTGMTATIMATMEITIITTMGTTMPERIKRSRRLPVAALAARPGLC
jgi:hypothetical protein